MGICFLVVVVTKPRKNNQAQLKCIPCINFINDDNAIIEQ